MPKLTYHSTTIRIISAPMLFILRQMPIGMETHHFQPIPVIHGPNPYPAVQLTGPASGYSSAARREK